MHTLVTAKWTGTHPGLPGYSKFTYAEALDATAAQSAANEDQAFFTGIKALLPSTVTITWDGVAIIVGLDGKATDAVAYTPPASVVGTGTTTGDTGVAGAVVWWNTGAFRNGRRVRGRTFLVPLASNAFLSGVVASTAVTTITTALSALTGSTPSQVVFCAPRTTKDGVALPGAEFPVNSTTVSTTSVILTSRRD